MTNLANGLASTLRHLDRDSCPNVVRRNPSFSAHPSNPSCSPRSPCTAYPLLDGALVAITTRLDWATLLRRTFEIDVMECASCGGRLHVLGSVTQSDAVREILERLAIPTEAPRAARARDPTDFEDDDTA
jgi:hypothetical protein